MHRSPGRPRGRIGAARRNRCRPLRAAGSEFSSNFSDVIGQPARRLRAGIRRMPRACNIASAYSTPTVRLSARNSYTADSGMRGQKTRARFQRAWPDKPWRCIPSAMACQIGPCRLIRRTSGRSRKSAGFWLARCNRSRSEADGGRTWEASNRTVLVIRGFISVRLSLIHLSFSYRRRSWADDARDNYAVIRRTGRPYHDKYFRPVVRVRS